MADTSYKFLQPGYTPPEAPPPAPTEQELLELWRRARSAGANDQAEVLANEIEKTRRKNLEGSQREAKAKGLPEQAQMLAGELTRTDTSPAESGLFGGVKNFVAGYGSGLTDKALGHRQAGAAAGVTGVDPQVLAAEAGRKKKLDDALLDTKAGFIGNVLGQGTIDALEFLGPGRALRGGMAMLPGVGRVLTNPVTGRIAEGAASGAASGVTQAEEDYQPGKQAAENAGFGILGELGGRAFGRVAKPTREVVPAIRREDLANLRGMPNQLAENLSPAEWIRNYTNALAGIPGAGQGVRNAREAQNRWVTRYATGQAGLPTDAFTDNYRQLLAMVVNDPGIQFRRGYVGPTPANVDALRAEVPGLRNTAALTGVGRPEDQVATALRGMEMAPPPLNPNVAAHAPAHMYVGTTGQRTIPYVPPGGPVTPLITADAAMDARKKLGDQVWQATNMVDPAGAAAVKTQIEDMLRTKYGPAFDTWKRETGWAADLSKLQPGDITATGRIKPAALERLMDTPVNKRTTQQLTIGSAGRVVNDPGLAENRSLLVRQLMLGLPGLAGGAGVAAAGVSAPFVAAAAAAPLATAHWLLGTPAGGRYLTGQNASRVGRAAQSQRTLEVLRRLGIGSAIETNATAR